MTAPNIYALAAFPTPVFNTLTNPFQLPLPRKEDGRMMAMETVAFPGTSFIVKAQNGFICQVESPEYPSKEPLYVDSRLLTPAHHLEERKKRLPSVDHILQMLQSLVGTRYFWGGNWPKGIPNLLVLYDHPDKIERSDISDAICEGVDCSGLLYYVTNGYTPRNTGGLIEYGTEVPKTNLEQLEKSVKPLDLIVWRGHVLILLPDQKIIESRIGRGVVISDFIPRMEEALKTLEEQNKPFYIRRWHPEMLV